MKPEWGIKRTCQECGAKFYDMKRPEIVCPKCATAFVEPVVKPRRAKAEPKAEPAPKKPVAKVKDPDLDIDDDDDIDIDVDDDDDDDDDDDIIEDTSDLGDDDDDVSEVREKISGEKEV